MDDFKYYFDTFDMFFLWGRRWKNIYHYQHFIKEFHEIGNVYLPPINNIKKPISKNKTLLLFNSDLETTVPQHHTLQYNIEFFVTIFEALEQLDKNGANNYTKVLIKLKDLKQENILLEQKEVKTIIEKLRVKPVFLRNKIFDTGTCIEQSDVVLSIGFTTPGIDALLLGKPSAYFTPYKYDYNKLFHSKSPFVLHDRNDVMNFLEKPIFFQELADDLDPFRDGAAAQRLLDYCQQFL